MSRTISEIIIHCSATPEGREVSSQSIAHYHTQERHWPHIGYHFLIHLDGTVEQTLPIDTEGIHCAGHNKNSIGICYIGGITSKGSPKDTRTIAQKNALSYLVTRLVNIHNIPPENIHGHNEFANKACPCFNVIEEKESWL